LNQFLLQTEITNAIADLSAELPERGAFCNNFGNYGAVLCNICGKIFTKVCESVLYCSILVKNCLHVVKYCLQVCGNAIHTITKKLVEIFVAIVVAIFIYAVMAVRAIAPYASMVPKFLWQQICHPVAGKFVEIMRVIVSHALEVVCKFLIAVMYDFITIYVPSLYHACMQVGMMTCHALWNGLQFICSSISS